MVTPILRLVLVIALLLQGNFWQPNPDDPDLPYHFFLPMIRQRTGTCELVDQVPQDGAFEEKGSSIVTHWILRNTGEKAWLADRTTIRFVSGDRLHTGADAVDIPYDVETGNLLDVFINMMAPQSAGSYVSAWTILDGTTRVCNFYIRFKVP